MPALNRKPDAAPAPQNFETELLLKITETYIRRRFSELTGAVARVRDAIEREQPLELDEDRDYARADAAARGPQTNHGWAP